MSKRNRGQAIQLPGYKQQVRGHRLARRYDVDWNAIIGDDFKLFTVIIRQVNALRLMKVIPTWAVWADGPVWVDDIKPFVTETEKLRYKAMWELIVLASKALTNDRINFMRVAYGLAICNQEKCARKCGEEYRYRVPVPCDAALVSLTVQDITALEEFARENCEFLFPWD